MTESSKANLHPTPTQLHYIYVFIALAFLTLLTAALSYLHWQKAIGVTLAMIIAFVKAFLVVSIFMHLRYEKRLLKIVLFASLALAFSFLAGSAGDYVPWVKRLCGL